MQWNLIRLRKERKLTQREMADFLKVDATTYQSKESGKTKFNADEMFLLSNFFALPMEQIFLPTNSNVIGILEEKIERHCN